MVVLVDGYNAIRWIERVAPSGLISDEERLGFVRRLQAYASRRKESIKRLFVVFDGGESRHADRYEHGIVTEVYSGFVESADDWIAKHVSRSGFSDYVVVTNDRGLCKRVTPHVKLIISVEDFSLLLKHALARQDQRAHGHVVAQLIEYGDDAFDSKDLDRESLWELMERSTRGMLSKKSDDSHENSSRISGPTTDSKELLRVRRIVKKL